MKTLLVVSNHSPETWTMEQNMGWERIDYIPFPDINPSFSREEVIKMSLPLCEKIGEWISNNPEGKVCLQGEFTLCYIIFRSIEDDIFIFPTTERVVEEKDGKRTYSFHFVRWR